ncbi:MAG: hypothetical protein WCD20_13125 [Rhodomicrobium sp.]
MKLLKNASCISAAALFAVIFAGPLFAQEGMEPGHPRVNEVQGRIDNQENRVDHGINSGKLTPGEAARDTRRDARVERQMKRDEAKHGGHITKGEQAKLNRELNHNSRDIHRQKNGN